MMSYKIAAKTLRGSVHPENQDGYCVLSATVGEKFVGLAAVCDGVGGLEGSELASGYTVERLRYFFRYLLVPMVRQGLSESAIYAQLVAWVDDINQALIERGKRRTNPIATTLSLLLLLDDRYLLFHLGDSRIYKYSSYTIQLTKDHAEVDQAGNGTRLTQCLGYHQTLEPLKTSGTLKKDDVLLLCTDGAFKKVGHDRINRILSLQVNEKSKLERLVSRARINHETDDITAVLLTAAG